MNRIGFLTLMIFSITALTMYSLLPNVDAKPFRDEITGIRIHCNVTEFSASCQINDPKNGISHVRVANEQNSNFDQSFECVKRVNTPNYDPILSNGVWIITVSNCNGNTSEFTLELIGGDLILIGINQI